MNISRLTISIEGTESVDSVVSMMKASLKRNPACVRIALEKPIGPCYRVSYFTLRTESQNSLDQDLKAFVEGFLKA